MNPADASKTAFMTERKNFYYRVMPFGLKNAGTTYQRLMDMVFAPQIGRNIEVYVDDMVIKTTSGADHVTDIRETFAAVRKFNMRLNPDKCTFGVQAGKFLGFMLTNRGIEANPDKCQAIIDMRSPTSVREVQQLTGRLAALSRFLSCAGDKSIHFFSAIKKRAQFEWTEACEEAFNSLKQLLSAPPVLVRPKENSQLTLYLAVTDGAVSSVLVQDTEEGERPVYFVSKVLKGAEIRYQKIEKLALALVTTARKLRHYFLGHPVQVKTNFPLKQVFKKPDLAGRMVSWAVELSEYEISFSPRTSIKSQSLADFVVELVSPPGKDSTQRWILSVDGSSNLKGSGAGVVLEGPGEMVLEYSLRFGFSTSNNQAEYEALLAGLRLTLEVGVTHLLVRTDSQLVAGRVDGSFQTKDPTLAKYVQQAVPLGRRFEVFEICHIVGEETPRADLLSRLASSKDSVINKSVIREVLPVPSVEKEESLAVHDEDDGWMSPIVRYLQQDTLPADRDKARRLKKVSSGFVVESGKLYRLGRAAPMLRCVGEKDMLVVMKEVHEGVCGNHGGGRALASRILRVGYYWPTLTRDCLEYVAQCSKCQTFVPAIHTPSEFL